jgi:hypothetical protein
MKELKSPKAGEWLKKIYNVSMAIVEVRQGESDKEAWQRHLAANPKDRYSDVWVFNRPWVP